MLLLTFIISWNNQLLVQSYGINTFIFDFVQILRTGLAKSLQMKYELNFRTSYEFYTVYISIK